MDLILQALGFIVVSSAVAVFGAYHVRRRVPLEVQMEQNDVAGFFLAVLGLVYGVLLAFAVIAVWEDLDQARSTAELEADAVGDVYRLAEGLPDDTRKVIQEQATSYASLVISDEWPLLMKGGPGRESEAALKQMEAIWATVRSVEPQGAREEAILDKLLDKVQEMNDERRARLVAAQEGIPLMVWLVLIGGGVVTVLFTYFFGLKNTRALLAMTGLYVASIGFVLFLIAAMDYPFRGAVSVRPEAMVMVLDRIEVLEAARR
ncbi:MAG: hypothetical protein AB7P40_15510 [Chloroflexota bacterium]